MYLIEILIPSRIHPWSEDCCAPAVIPNLIEQGKRPTLPLFDKAKQPEACKLVNMIKMCWCEESSQRHTAKHLLKGFTRPDEMEQFALENWTREEAGLKVQVIPLEIHQGTVMSVAGEISASILKHGGDMPDAVLRDIESFYRLYDGSNACQYLSAAVANFTLDWKPDDIFSNAVQQRTKDSIEKLFISVPEQINSIRDLARYYYY